MVTKTLFLAEEWRTALENAKQFRFDASEMHYHMDASLLEDFLCERFHGQDNEHQDSEFTAMFLEAVICVLTEAHAHGGFTSEEFDIVSDSHLGASSNDWKELVRGLPDTQQPMDDLPSNPTEDDYRVWYQNNCISETEVYTEVGEYLFWFDTTRWGSA